MIQKLKDFPFRFPILASLVMGVISAGAMEPMSFWPLLMLGFSGMIFIMGRVESRWKGAWCVFAYGMAYFTVGVWWVINALMVDIEMYWWAMGFAILGLPLLLSLLWFVAGYLTVRFSRPQSYARAVLFITLLGLAEYGRAFNLTGFPWNLFGYTWAHNAVMMQLASLGGVYLVTILTMYWMGLPAFLYYAKPNRKLCLMIVGVWLLSVGAAATYGALRLHNNPTEYRTDIQALIIQPNVRPEEKMQNTNGQGIFSMQVALTEQGLKEIKPTPDLKTVAIIWPETALDEHLIMQVPDAAKALVDMLTRNDTPYDKELVTGLWRQGEPKPSGRPSYYNSLGLISESDGKIQLDDLYDKHHLVPFGEFVPLEQTLGLTPLVGFAGFEWGTGPRVLTKTNFPPVSPMICFEAIFPWYAKSEGAEWLVNTSNDGWYGNTSGPHQHLAMTRYRAVEQGKPIMRSATTGISAVIDSYGRVIKGLPYYAQGYIVSDFPRFIAGGTLYTRIGESLFFLIIGLGLAVFWRFRTRQI